MSNSLKDVADALRDADELLLMTHEHPDGDAVGSLVAAHRVLAAVGIDAPILIAADDEPAAEYHFLVPWESTIRELPADLSKTTLVMLDCGNLERSAGGLLGAEAGLVVNIDHHHDNTRFGSVNHVVDSASCTAEIVWDLAAELGADVDQLTATALYVGLVTDTGRFMYDNTGPAAHEMAAELIRIGVPVAAMFRRIYEGIPEGRARLLGRALSQLERHHGGRLTLTWLSREDFELAEALDGWSEGVIDHLRAIEGTEVAAVIREPSLNPGSRRISLRAANDEVDVSRIARAGGGGGHRGAAGFSSDLSPEELRAFLLDQMAAEPSTP